MKLTRCSFVRLLALAAILLPGIPAQAAQPGGPEMSRVSAGSPGAIIEAPSGQEEAELLAFDSSFTAKLLGLAPEESLRADDWPIAPGKRQSVVLTRRDIYAPDARIVMMEGGREVELPRSRLAFFLGEIQDGTKGRVMVSIDPDTGTLGGFSATNEGYFEIVPPQGRRTGYLVASPSSLRKPGEPAPAWRCGQEELPPNWGNYTPRPEARQPLVQSPPTKVAVLAIDTDNEFMLQKFSDNTTNATNYIAQLVASITTIYERDALVRIYEGYTILRVSTTADPYTQNSGGNASGPELSEFGSYWSANYGNVRRTLATILSGKQPGSSSASGIAWIGGLCSTGYGYSFCQIFKSSYLVGDTLIVAHEMGHNFGSPHTHCYSPPADYCYNGEGGCWSGGTSCPTAYSITTASSAVVTGVTGTLMSYCHLLGGCEPDLTKELVFHLRSLSEYLNSNISSASGCIFAIGNAAPTITSLSVTSGPTTGGTSTNITGTNFQSGATVAFANLTNSVGATSVTFNSSSSLTVHTPAHAAGAVDVVVMNPDFQTATLPGGFTYSAAAPPPTVSVIAPNNGATLGGTSVTITGASFVNGATVSIGGVAATGVSFVNAMTLTATTGVHATGTVNVVVTNPDTQTGTLASGYFYAPPATSAAFYTLTPCRVLDTRGANGAYGGPALNGNGARRSFVVAGQCGVPVGAKSVSANVTVTGPTAGGSLVLFPGNGIPTGTSSINFSAGQTRANNAILLLATDGSGSITVENDSAGTTHFILDVNGYFQ